MKSCSPLATAIKIDVVEGISLTVDPIDFLDIAIARAAADAVISNLDSSIDTFDTLGIPFDRSAYDPQSDTAREGLRHVIFVSELATAKVKSWDGILDATKDDTPLACTAENIRAVVRANFLIADAFWRKALSWHVEYLRAKKGFAVGANGKQSPVPAANIAKAAN